MKKLLLKNLDLNPEDMLNRDHLKTIFGGYGGYDGDFNCSVPGTKCTSSSQCGGNCPNCVKVPEQDYSICATS